MLVKDKAFEDAKKSPGKKFYTYKGYYIREENHVYLWYYDHSTDSYDFRMYDLQGSVIQY